MSDPTELKAWLDLYGVGVRAGAITPQMEDEEYIRNKLGLPVMNDGAKSDWAEGDGIRKPITLQQTGQDIADQRVSTPSEDGEDEQ